VPDPDRSFSFSAADILALNPDRIVVVTDDKTSRQHVIELVVGEHVFTIEAENDPLLKLQLIELIVEHLSYATGNSFVLKRCRGHAEVSEDEYECLTCVKDATDKGRQTSIVRQAVKELMRDEPWEEGRVVLVLECTMHERSIVLEHGGEPLISIPDSFTPDNIVKQFVQSIKQNELTFPLSFTLKHLGRRGKGNYRVWTQEALLPTMTAAVPECLEGTSSPAA